MGFKINIVFFIFTLIVSAFSAGAQELNATVTVNSDRVQTTDRNIFSTLQRGLSELINQQKWSSTTFASNEKIDCTFTVTVMTLESNIFTTELFVQARRPVYNSSYITPVLNIRDTNLEFEYQENQTILFQENSIDNNLVATIAFYCNLILALDFDSFSSLGGASFFREAQRIAMQAQSTQWKGWSAFDDNRSRSSIISVYTDESLKPFREYWYTYHRKGLDEMAANADRARTTILNGLSVLKDVRNIRNSEVVLQMFADCKLDEIVSLSSKATAEDKKSAYDLLRSIFPASSSQLEPLKK